MASTSLVCYSSGRSIQTVPTSAVSAEDFESKVIFDAIEFQLKENGPEFVKKINGVLCFKVKKGKDEGVWIVDAKNGNGEVRFDPSGKGDITISVSDDDLLKLMTGQLSPQKAFILRKLKVSGNMSLAMKLRKLRQEIEKSKL